MKQMLASADSPDGLARIHTLAEEAKAEPKAVELREIRRSLSRALDALWKGVAGVTEEFVLEMITPEACREMSRASRSPLAMAGEYDLPVAVVAKLVEETVKTPQDLLKKTRGHRDFTPLHFYADRSTSEASVAMVIAANPEALKAYDCNGKTPYDWAQRKDSWMNASGDNTQVKDMFKSAKTADGLARIQRLAKEVKAEPGQAAAAVERYRAEVAAKAVPVRPVALCARPHPHR